MTEFEVESMSDGSEPEDELDDSDLEVNILINKLKCRIFVCAMRYLNDYLHFFFS